MLEGQFIRTDRDTFAAFSSSGIGSRIEQLRDHFSPEEVAMFGIDQPYGERYEDTTPEANPLLSGLAASLTTTLLFAGLGLLSLPPGALA